MIADLKPYSAYKDSGVPWLGNVPAHWDVRRLKQICRFAYGDSLSSDHRMEGDVSVFGSNGRVGSHALANTVGPTIIVGRKGSFGKVNFSHAPVFAIDTTFLIDERHTQSDLRWLFHTLGWLRLDAVSKDSAVPGLDRMDAYEMVAPYPVANDEQVAIARFIDHADRHIQRYIRAKQKLAALLNEEKQAIIHRAVTRGLDPDVRLKPSGAELLGEIPEHWQVVTLGNVCSRILDGPHVSPTYYDDGAMFISARNIKVDSWAFADAKFISWDDYETFSRRVTPKRGDVLYTKGGTTGVARVVDFDEPFQVWVHVAILKVIERLIDPFYLAYSLNSPRGYEQSQLHTRGATNQDLGLNRMARIQIALPPVHEQTRIVQYLDAQNRGLRETALKATREIELLREYRTRLIADVVTGKLDVRGVELPALDESELNDSTGVMNEMNGDDDTGESEVGDDADN